jgi:hypothetical protein
MSERDNWSRSKISLEVNFIERKTQILRQLRIAYTNMKSVTYAKLNQHHTRLFGPENSVFLPEVELTLYRYLLLEAYRLLDYPYSKASEAADEDIKHEVEHWVEENNSQAHCFFGVAFLLIHYEGQRIPALQPVLDIRGPLSPEEIQRIRSSSSTFSLRDRMDILGNRTRKPRSE